MAMKPIITSLSLFIASSCFAAPNFLFIIGDDCSRTDLELYGGQAKTPNLLKLAAQGMTFNRSFQAAPMCSPTRHNLYTGLYPVKSGAYPNHTFVKDGVKSVVQHLKPLGYRVALSGKRHVNPSEVFAFEGKATGNNPNFEWIDEFMAECKKSETPFCLFACSNEPHSPWNKGDASKYPPEKLDLPSTWVDTPEQRDAYSRYLAEITYYDSQLGECMRLLDKHGIAENTLLIFTSEQGSAFPFAKWTCYDTGLHNGFVARWPQVIKADTKTDAMIEYVDLLPTYLDAAGADVPADLDGKSYLPVLKGETKHHKDHVYGIHTTRGIINGSTTFGIRSIRSEKFKLIVNLSPEIMFQNACTKSREFKSWEAAAQTDSDAADKVKRYRWRPAIEFYDITQDPLEWNNLASNPEYASEVQKLRSKLDAWMKEQGDLGQATEEKARDHQKRGNNKKKKNKKNTDNN